MNRNVNTGADSARPKGHGSSSEEEDDDEMGHQKVTGRKLPPDEEDTKPEATTTTSQQKKRPAARDDEAGLDVKPEAITAEPKKMKVDKEAEDEDPEIPASGNSGPDAAQVESKQVESKEDEHSPGDANVAPGMIPRAAAPVDPRPSVDSISIAKSVAHGSLASLYNHHMARQMIGGGIAVPVQSLPAVPVPEDNAIPGAEQHLQLLLHLHHASQCTLGDSCPVESCAESVALWNHLKNCHDEHCQARQCLASRCVLHHMRLCKDLGRTDNCPVCGPFLAQTQREAEESQK